MYATHPHHLTSQIPLLVFTSFILCLMFHFWISLPPLDEPSRDYNLPYTSTQTSITDLTPDVDYSVSINSYHGSEESINIFGQLTSKFQSISFQ